MIKQAFGDDAFGQTQTYNWFNRFKNGRRSVDDDECFARTLTSTTKENVVKVHEAILKDRSWTIPDICNIVGLSYGTCKRILSDKLNTRQIAAKKLYTFLALFGLQKKVVVLHTPYSPDSAPCDFLLLLKMKIKLKGQRFDIVEEI